MPWCHPVSCRSGVRFCVVFSVCFYFWTINVSEECGASSNARKVHTVELVVDTAQVVAAPDPTINARKVCTTVLALTGSTTDRMNLERPRGQVQGSGKATPVKGGGGI
jgi:hypothetical protein